MAVYQSKRDWWLMGILWLCAGFSIYFTFTVHDEPVAPWMQVFATCFFGLFSLLISGLCVLPYYTKYSIDSVNLTIIVGPLHFPVVIKDIIAVYPTMNPLSAPAWSLDRLKICLSNSKYGVLVSPVRQKEFLEQLNEVATHLQFKDSGLVKVGKAQLVKEKNKLGKRWL